MSKVQSLPVKVLGYTLSRAVGFTNRDPELAAALSVEPLHGLAVRSRQDVTLKGRLGGEGVVESAVEVGARGAGEGKGKGEGDQGSARA